MKLLAPTSQVYDVFLTAPSANTGTRSKDWKKYIVIIIHIVRTFVGCLDDWSISESDTDLWDVQILVPRKPFKINEWCGMGLHHCRGRMGRVIQPLRPTHHCSILSGGFTLSNSSGTNGPRTNQPMDQRMDGWIKPLLQSRVRDRKRNHLKSRIFIQ